VKQNLSLVRVSIEVRIGSGPIILITTLNVPHHQNLRRTKSLIPQLLARRALSIILVGSQMKSGLNANARVYATSVGRSGTHPTPFDTASNTWC